jgi:fatty acid desaturase
MAGDPAVLRIWLRHCLAVMLLLWLIARFGSLHPAAYLLAAYFGMGLLMVRSFIEHQATEKANQRSVIIETRGPLSLLFLNNNFHSVHHAYPSLAWYRIPAFFRENRSRFLRMNGGYRYESYWEVFRRYGFRAKEPVAYPMEVRRKKRGNQ